MGDYNVDPQFEGRVYHVIYCRSGWATCQGEHEKVAEVKDCFRKARTMAADPVTYFPCNWLIEVAGEDFPEIHDCGALARVTARGFDCEAGHEHVSLDARRAEGWDYAEDEGEAAQLAKAGTEPRTMDAGRVWV